MHPDVAKVIAERAIRNQHLPMTRTRADSRDEKAWTKHDNEKHPYRYGLCKVCEEL